MSGNRTKDYEGMIGWELLNFQAKKQYRKDTLKNIMGVLSDACQDEQFIVNSWAKNKSSSPNKNK